MSIVIPFLNEERNVPLLLARLYEVLAGESFEVVCVDDGSRDGTAAALEAEAASRPGLVVLRLPTNRGQHRALLAGFSIAAGEHIITLDADLQNPPEEIPRLLRLLREGFDYVGTYRQGRRDPLLRRSASWCINGLVRRLARLGIRDLGCMLRGYHRSVVDRVLEAAGERVYLPALAVLCAHAPVEIPVAHAARAVGRSSYSLRRLLALTADLAHEVHAFRRASHGRRRRAAGGLLLSGDGRPSSFP